MVSIGQETVAAEKWSERHEVETSSKSVLTHCEAWEHQEWRRWYRNCFFCVYKELLFLGWLPGDDTCRKFCDPIWHSFLWCLKQLQEQLFFFFFLLPGFFQVQLAASTCYVSQQFSRWLSQAGNCNVPLSVKDWQGKHSLCLGFSSVWGN